MIVGLVTKDSLRSVLNRNPVDSKECAHPCRYIVAIRNQVWKEISYLIRANGAIRAIY